MGMRGDSRASVCRVTCPDEPDHAHLVAVRRVLVVEDVEQP
ncbi:hypothetical protein [Streptomyces sp. KL116D]